MAVVLARHWNDCRSRLQTVVNRHRLILRRRPSSPQVLPPEGFFIFVTTLGNCFINNPFQLKNTASEIMAVCVPIFFCISLCFLFAFDESHEKSRNHEKREKRRDRQTKNNRATQSPPEFIRKSNRDDSRDRAE